MVKGQWPGQWGGLVSGEVQYLWGSGPAFAMARLAALNLSCSDFHFTVATSYRAVQHLTSVAGIPFSTALLPFPACLVVLAMAAAALSPSCTSIAAMQASPVASMAFPPGLTFSLAVCLFFSLIQSFAC